MFSGIEAATVAWKPLGWECVAVAEIEPFPCAVLAHHYPEVPNLGDVTAVTEEQIAALGQIDLIVFGSPCQDLSVAGKRKGLLDANGNATRSGLFFTAINIIRWARQHCGARWALWENVPGAFSSNGGRDFAAVVEWLAGLDDVAVPPNGWGTEGVALGEHGLVEWCVLDAQWFGVAQRRRRVFAVADFGDWRNRPPVLLERNSLRRDTAPSRKAGQAAAAGTLRSTQGGSDVDHARAGHIQPVGYRMVAFGEYADDGTACTMKARDYKDATDLAVQCVTGDITHTLKAEGFDASEDGTGRGQPIAPVAGTLGANHGNIKAEHAWTGQLVPTNGKAMAVRRLTPTECERLQGFPDGYTLVPFRNKPAADGPRYKALGNSMAVPVMRWIGEQIDTVEVFQ